jgi:hypothetical protein
VRSLALAAIARSIAEDRGRGKENADIFPGRNPATLWWQINPDFSIVESGGAMTDDQARGGVPMTSYKLRRHRRTRPRGTTIAMKRISMAELRQGAELYPPVDLERPRTRADCGAEQRPCPWVACKHHLYLDINPETGSIKLNYPDREPWELEHSCALDVADTGAKTLDEIGEITNLTRERIRQVEVRGLRKLQTRRELR